MTANPDRNLLPLFVALTLCLAALGCSVAAAKHEASEDASVSRSTSKVSSATKRYASGATIEIARNSPADTVRVFYQNLREGKIRAAIYLTNLRPAIEGLTDAELKEFQVDFEAVGRQVPEKLEINGEITTGDRATVTVKLPGADDPDRLEIQEVHLRRDGVVWVILSVDEEAEKKVKQEGKNYFSVLKIETHQDEARKMLDRIAKAQIAFAAQNGGVFGEMAQLIDSGFLPEDARSSESTGYAYAVKLAADKKTYSATATPAVYGKTGRLTFSVELKGNKPHLSSRDDGAK